MNEEKQLELFQYRMAMLLGSIVYPFFGWFSESFLKVTYDSFLHRLPIAIFCFIFFILSYKIILIRKNMRWIFLIMACWCMHDYIGFFAQSNYHYYFSIGLTAMPFIIFILFFYPIDILFFFIFSLIAGAYYLNDSNHVFIVTYLILSVTAFSIYVLVTRNRLNLLNELRKNIEQIEKNQELIDEKNQSLIKIGELATQVAHDIRSPVTALQAVFQMLDQNVDPNQRQLIQNAAKRINDIADNLVSTYRKNLTQDLNSVNINRNIDLNSLIEDIVEEKKLSLDPKNKILFKSVESIRVPQSLNASEFQRIISNLLNNSIEAFDKSYGMIDVSLSRKDDHVHITLRDNGKGIPSDKLTKVFERGISTKAQGAGLGLAHAKQYIESIGGSIQIASIPEKETQIIIELVA